MKYKRILLKLSGESLQGEQKYGLSPAVLQSYAEQIRDAAASGVQIGIVIGGGNIFRGLSGAKRGFDRVKGDQMGMLATIINSLALHIFYGYAWSVLAARVPNALIRTAVNTVLLRLLMENKAVMAAVKK